MGHPELNRTRTKGLVRSQCTHMYVNPMYTPAGARLRLLQVDGPGTFSPRRERRCTCTLDEGAKGDTGDSDANEVAILCDGK